MPSLEPRAGERYLTAAGVPVQVLEVHEGSIVLQGLASDNRFVVPAGYPLRPFKGEVEAFEVRPSPYHGPQAKPRRGQAQPKPLAPIIDAMLLVGVHSMRGIVRDVRRKASTASRSKDLEANVRARIYWLKKRGYQVQNFYITSTLPLHCCFMFRCIIFHDKRHPPENTQRHRRFR